MNTYTLTISFNTPKTLTQDDLKCTADVIHAGLIDLNRDGGVISIHKTGDGARGTRIKVTVADH